MRMLLFLFVLLSSCASTRQLPAKSKRPKTDILIMSGVLILVIVWSHEEGFNKHTK